MFDRILVPLDGSGLGELALPYAEELAGVLNSEVALMHVCESTDSQYRHMHRLYMEKIAQEVQERIEGYRTEKSVLSAPVKTVILDGDPAAEIIDYAEKNDVSLVVMVSHGRSGLMPWSMGSTAFRVTQRISKPILFIRARTPGLKASRGEILSKVVVTLDGSENAEATLPYIKELANELKSEVTLLRVVEPGQYVHTVGGLNYVLFPEQEVKHLKTEAEQYLQKAISKLSATQATIKSEVKIGHAAQEIIKFADEAEACLVAISTHGRSGLRRWFTGSVAYKVLHAGNKPVLLVRAPGLNNSK